MKVVHVVGARPNFMKAAPVIKALSTYPQLRQTLIHTGQHYDRDMSEIFFRELGLPEPDINLGVGSASHASQTAEVMLRFEKAVLQENPNLVLVYGDVNSTVACALVSVKLGIKVGHVEAGLRSRDRSMPEEINRILTDHCSNYYFTPSDDADLNLINEGLGSEGIFMVGNLMIDTLVELLPKARPPKIPELDLPYALVTLHRPANVDHPEMLGKIIAMLYALSKQLPVIFPLHPRTHKKIADSSTGAIGNPRLKMINPLGYLEFLWLQKHACVVITDSGGIQEETTYLRVPCLTFRENTERPITCEMGSNQLVGCDTEKVKAEVSSILDGRARKGRGIPPLWDGQSGQRVARLIASRIFHL